MRTALTMSVAAVAVGLGTISLRAAPTGIAAMPKAAPLTQPVQDNYYGSYTTGQGWGYGFNFTAACRPIITIPAGRTRMATAIAAAC